jgi:hypothetical protein
MCPALEELVVHCGNHFYLLLCFIPLEFLSTNKAFGFLHGLNLWSLISIFDRYFDLVLDCLFKS